MKPSLLPILAAIALSGCDRTAKVSKAPPPVPAPLPAAAEAEIPGPASPTVTVKAGANLGRIAADAYGHEEFSGFIARLNGIANPEQLKADSVLKTPPLPQAFREAGLDPCSQPAINALAKASTDYHDALPGYVEARLASAEKGSPVPIPEKTRDSFLKCADAIDAAKRELEGAKEPHQVPSMTLDQFAQAASLLRELATGSVDGYGYDADLIGQRLGLGFTNALIWTQVQHR